jgi:hypothetical protein
MSRLKEYLQPRLSGGFHGRRGGKDKTACGLGGGCGLEDCALVAAQNG